MEKRKRSRAKEVRRIAEEKYERGEKNSHEVRKTITNKKLRRELQHQEDIYAEAQRSAASAEILLPEQEGFLEADPDNPLERTFRVKQREVKAAHLRARHFT